MTTPGAWVLLNEAARQHRARQLWTQIVPKLPIAPWRTVALDRAGRWRARLSQALELGYSHFIAAGGDGTVGSLVDALYQSGGSQCFEHITVGAVGLGSSNDFHKPFSSTVEGVPLLVDPAVTRLRDLGLVSYHSPDGALGERCFAVSASVGVVARANALFNEARGTIRVLKTHSPTLAIVAAALEAVAAARNQRLRVAAPQLERWLSVTNLSVGKTPHLAGSLAYDTEVVPDDGLFAVHLCQDMSRWELLATLIALARGRFGNRRKTLAASWPAITIESESPFELELDGEILVTRRASFRIMPVRARVCS